MSFASEVKKELFSIPNQPCCEKAQLMGILRCLSEIVIVKNQMKIKVTTKLSSVLRHIVPLLRKHYQAEGDLSYQDNLSMDKKRSYGVMISSNADKVIKELSLLPYEEVDLNHPLLKKECCQTAFIRGNFIARGSINDPKKSNYHLEILYKNESDALLAITILAKNYMNARISERKNGTLMYIKKAEEISNFLAFIGAANGIFYFEDSRILRDLNNSVNRIMNCDIANSNKSLQTCQYQLEAIKYLEDEGIVDKLTPRLRDAINLRKEYPDSSLKELSEYSYNVLGKEMSRSGINHCLREIVSIYEKRKQPLKELND
ncbi:MAG: DNA-binding protein WhiA [Bacilli bacterium]|jgi:DNA-binding protein WhiA|nr:DNA-binding protein WhiA [Acholeplasmataceae bacterium]